MFSGSGFRPFGIDYPAALSLNARRRHLASLAVLRNER
jgi:hypothetical protein